MSTTTTAERSCPPCRACGSARTRPYLSGDRDRLKREIQRPFQYFLCADCRLRFQNVDKEEAGSLYGDLEDLARTSRPRTRQVLTCDADVLRTFEQLSPGRRLLDVGAGDGGFLTAARQAGFDVTGTDISERLARLARQRSGAPVLVGQLTELDLPRESFDGVNLDGVLIYVTEPRPLLQHIAGLLRPGGVCRIREYNPDSLRARLAGRRYWVYGPTHPNVWPPRSIRALADAAGLRLLRTFAGTEASLSRWLAARRRPTLLNRVVDTVGFQVRRLRVGDLCLGADTVYYLQKPAR